MPGACAVPVAPTNERRRPTPRQMDYINGTDKADASNSEHDRTLLEDEPTDDQDGDDDEDAAPPLVADGGIVPEDFDADTLEERKRAPSTTDPEDQPRCPECGRQYVLPATGDRSRQGRNSDYDYRCDKCCAQLTEEQLEFGPAGEDDTPTAFLGPDTHWCDICRSALLTLEALAEHECRPHDPLPDGERQLVTDGGAPAPEKVIERPGFVADLGLLERDGRAAFLERPPDAEWEVRLSMPAAHLDQFAAWWLQQRQDADALTADVSGSGPDILTDGGQTHIEEESYYVVDEDLNVVRSGPHETANRAADAADHSRREVVVRGGALRDARATRATPLRWEADDGPDLVTDGGVAVDGEPLPMPDDDVCLIGSHTSTHKHVPDENGKPICNATATTDTGWREKDPAVVPHRPWCLVCRQTLDRDAGGEE